MMKIHHLLEQELDSFDEPPVGGDINDHVKYWGEVIQQVETTRQQALVPVRMFEKKHRIEQAESIIHQLHRHEYKVFHHDSSNAANVVIRKSIAIPVDATPSPEHVYERWKDVYSACTANLRQYDEMLHFAIRHRRHWFRRRCQQQADCIKASKAQRD